MASADHKATIDLFTQIVEISLEGVMKYDELAAKALDGVRAAMVDQGIDADQLEAFIAQSEADRAAVRPAMINRVVSKAMAFVASQAGQAQITFTLIGGANDV